MRVKMVRGTAKVNENDSRLRVNTLGLRDGKAKAVALLKCFTPGKTSVAGHRSGKSSAAGKTGGNQVSAGKWLGFLDLTE